ncbi:MAG TPA: hypothetical protein VG225_12080 [Terracidiphilus sp.]|jgi:hypothetical protein|nr:hypothetical protein [Terracidiphilus sp.]
MLRRPLCFAALLLGCSALIHTQSPKDGHVLGPSYENSYFKFTYTWPKFLQPFDMNSLLFPKRSPSNNEFLLFSARQGGEPDGIVVVAERMNVPTQHSGGLKSSSDFMDLIAHFRPEQHVTSQSRKHFTNADGLVFDELDYVEDGVPSSAIIFQMKDFLIAFKCNAKSVNELNEMNKSIAEIRKTK